MREGAELRAEAMAGGGRTVKSFPSLAIFAAMTCGIALVCAVLPRGFGAGSYEVRCLTSSRNDAPSCVLWITPSCRCANSRYIDFYTMAAAAQGSRCTTRQDVASARSPSRQPNCCCSILCPACFRKEPRHGQSPLCVSSCGCQGGGSQVDSGWKRTDHAQQQAPQTPNPPGQGRCQGRCSG